MTTHPSRSGLGRSVEEGRDGLLRLVLKLDAAATGGIGVLLVTASPMLDELLGLPLALLRLVGLFLIVYAAAIWIVGSRQRISRPAVWAAISINLLWTFDSIVLVAAGWFPLTGLGAVFVLVQAAAVAAIAAAQVYALRKATQQR